MKYYHSFLSLCSLASGKISLLIIVVSLLCYAESSLASEKDSKLWHLTSYNKVSDSPRRCTVLFFNTCFYDFADGTLDELFTCPSKEELDMIRKQFDDSFYSDSVNQMDIEFVIDTNGELELNQNEYENFLRSIEFPVFKFSNNPLKSYWHYTITGITVEQMPQPKGGEMGLLRFLQDLYRKVGIKNKQLKNGFSYVCHINGRGDVDDVIIVKSVSEKKDLKLMQGLKELHFTPGRKNGRAVDAWFLFDSKFYVKCLKESDLKN